MSIYESKNGGKNINHGINYSPHTHTLEGGWERGLIRLPCTQGQLYMDAKLFDETTKYQKF